MSTIEREGVSAPAEREQSDRERRASTLEAAALEIEVRGWRQYAACGTDGRVCLVGAILVSLGEEVTPDEIYGNTVAAGRAWGVGFEQGNFDPEPMRFNDDDRRTVDEVTFLLRWRAEEIRDGR